MTRIPGALRDVLCTFMINSSQTKVAGKMKMKTHVLCSVTPPPPESSCRLWDKVEKWGRAREATDDSTIRCMRVACWVTRLAVTFVRTLPVLCSPSIGCHWAEVLAIHWQAVNRKDSENFKMLIIILFGNVNRINFTDKLCKYKFFADGSATPRRVWMKYGRVIYCHLGVPERFLFVW